MTTVTSSGQGVNERGSSGVNVDNEYTICFNACTAVPAARETTMLDGPGLAAHQLYEHGCLWQVRWPSLTAGWKLASSSLRVNGRRKLLRARITLAYLPSWSKVKGTHNFASDNTLSLSFSFLFVVTRFR